MSKKEKLIKKLKTIPKDFTYEEMCTLLEMLEFKLKKSGKTGGSRIRYEKENTPVLLHKPHPRKELLKYQLEQILSILEKEGLL